MVFLCKLMHLPTYVMLVLDVLLHYFFQNLQSWYTCCTLPLVGGLFKYNTESFVIIVYHHTAVHNTLANFQYYHIEQILNNQWQKNHNIHRNGWILFVYINLYKDRHLTLIIYDHYIHLILKVSELWSLTWVLNVFKQITLKKIFMHLYNLHNSNHIKIQWTLKNVDRETCFIQPSRLVRQKQIRFH